MQLVLKKHATCIFNGDAQCVFSGLGNAALMTCLNVWKREWGRTISLQVFVLAKARSYSSFILVRTLSWSMLGPCHPRNNVQKARKLTSHATHMLITGKITFLPVSVPMCVCFRIELGTQVLWGSNTTEFTDILSLLNYLYCGYYYHYCCWYNILSWGVLGPEKTPRGSRAVSGADERNQRLHLLGPRGYSYSGGCEGWEGF